ncbi:glycosyltransferase [Spiribacter vilamensis]|uniref:Glycosyl transferase family 2 n=1 Tax=Spiribacter vilamensis TaxID=531306 RepID=A0A4V2GIZ8_9GAMM|nr:glycosyltransferase [Spiribacter vilamensis]RZU98355.1 glycosyl transferase family 2 [Spiribacter vilamensis]TVO60762.1 glycosyltransferase [Spiribacter vilamensis]
MRCSVIIPCHNNAGTIAGALESVRMQAYPATEIIVIDDASDDDSAAIAAATGIPDRILRVEHRNAAAARNAGIAQASCEWVAFLDADNHWLLDHLATARVLLEAGNDGVFYASPLAAGQQARDGFGVMRSGHPLKQAATGLDRDTFLDWRLRWGWGFPTTGIVISRSILQEIGGFDVTQIKRHDFELVMRAICHATWCATPIATWWSHPPRPGDISADPVDCAFYAFRAVQRNEARYSGRRFSRLLSRSAYRAALTAYRHGDRQSVSNAVGDGKRYLKTHQLARLSLVTLSNWFK